jgi:hypothetical protein
MVGTSIETIKIPTPLPSLFRPEAFANKPNQVLSNLGSHEPHRQAVASGGWHRKCRISDEGHIGKKEAEIWGNDALQGIQ